MIDETLYHIGIMGEAEQGAWPPSENPSPEENKMEKWLGRYSNFFYALLRFVAGALFACHGAQKLFHVFGGPRGGSLFQAAGVIETICGTLIAVGFFASCFAFVACGEMAVAFFKQHFPAGFWPIMNGGELAVLYCFIFLYIASRGSGILSISALFGKARRR